MSYLIKIKNNQICNWQTKQDQSLLHEKSAVVLLTAAFTLNAILLSAPEACTDIPLIASKTINKIYYVYRNKRQICKLQNWACKSTYYTGLFKRREGLKGARVAFISQKQCKHLALHSQLALTIFNSLDLSPSTLYFFPSFHVYSRLFAADLRAACAVHCPVPK